MSCTEADTSPKPDEYCEASLIAALKTYGYTPVYLETTTSTMDHARLIGVSKAAVVANTQDAGRGQWGRKWAATKDRSVLMTVVEPFSQKDGDPRPTSLLPNQMFILASCVALQEVTGNSDIKIRWPNDLTVHGQKLGGLLVENPAFSKDAPYPLLFGIGMNVHYKNANAAFPNTDYGAISIDELGGKYVRREEIIIAILKKWVSFRADLRRVAIEGQFSDTYGYYNNLWRENAALLKQEVRYWRDRTHYPEDFIQGSVTDSSLGRGLMIGTTEVVLFSRDSKLEVLTN